ncbi:MAG: Phenylalanine--tRNA ligase beta subunit [Candidatus Bathyarchaeota archaeon BA1]|nr:MAG: Phenylalanine--tRNA ligase beta subunit [Candidatus Bathyarchaeota archaeon BA1]
MPVIILNKERFCAYIGQPITVEDMAKWLPWLGVDIEEVGPDYLKVEFNPNRVDLSSYAGVARAFRGLMGWETGLPKYVVREGQNVLNVDTTVAEVRPYVVSAIIRNIRLDDESVRELMEMQEDLHWGVGRNRRKASIGVHNLDRVEPPFAYTTGDPDGVRFVPLGKTEEMSMREILERHEKGIAYRHIIDWAPRYPLIVDDNGRVLSMPPIINSELTRVDSQTKNLFIDITGTDQNAITRSLNVLVAALADMGGIIEGVQVRYLDRTIISPDLTPQKMKMRIDYASGLLGLRLSEAKATQCLKKCRMDVIRIGKGVLEVLIPVYRIDILHEVDLVEEVAIGYGYFRLKPSRPKTITTGKLHRASESANYVRQIMIGMGFTEATNFILTNETIHYGKMRRKIGRMVKLANPASIEHSIAREDLLPGLMKNLTDNRHESYPQQLFEVSDVIKIRREAETCSERRLHVAGVSSHATANFTEIKSFTEALLANLGLTKWEIKETRHPSFMQGRVAAIYAGNRKIGIVGEVHPEVLNNFEIENPTSAFEIDLEEIL